MTKGAGALPHIRFIKEQDGGRFVDLVNVTCSRCRVPRNWPRFPPDKAGKNLTQRGYQAPLDPKSILCPPCVAELEREKEAARIALRSRALAIAAPAIPSVTSTQERSFMPSTTPVKPRTVEAPRDATPQDNIRILDALETAYDRKAGYYHSDGSDARIAEALKVPRAWVTSIRSQLFGSQDTNQKRREAPARLDEIEDRLKGHEDRLYEALSAIESDRKALTALRTQLVTP